METRECTRALRGTGKGAGWVLGRVEKAQRFVLPPNRQRQWAKLSEQRAAVPAVLTCGVLSPTVACWLPHCPQGANGQEAFGHVCGCGAQERSGM